MRPDVHHGSDEVLYCLPIGHNPSKTKGMFSIKTPERNFQWARGTSSSDLLVE